MVIFLLLQCYLWLVMYKFHFFTYADRASDARFILNGAAIKQSMQLQWKALLFQEESRAPRMGRAKRNPPTVGNKPDYG